MITHPMVIGDDTRILNKTDTSLVRWMSLTLKAKLNMTTMRSQVMTSVSRGLETLDQAHDCYNVASSAEKRSSPTLVANLSVPLSDTTGFILFTTFLRYATCQYSLAHSIPVTRAAIYIVWTDIRIHVWNSCPAVLEQSNVKNTSRLLRINVHLIKHTKTAAMLELLVLWMHSLIYHAHSTAYTFNNGVHLKANL
jgi:hypothetical protein